MIKFSNSLSPQPTPDGTPNFAWSSAMSRRDFIAASVSALALTLPLARGEETAPQPMVDIHMHRNLPRTRTAEQMVLHQKNIGATLTVVLPLVDTHDDNEEIFKFTQSDPTRWVCFAVEEAASEGAIKKLEQALKRGAIGLGELKDKIPCDAPQLQEFAALARDHDVPMLYHFEDGNRNDGYVRFHRMLEKFPTVKFIGHGPSFWAYISKDYQPHSGLPTGPVMRGGLTDRWLTDYPNFHGDLSAGSGNNGLTRDRAFAADFVRRHQDKLMFGSDCPCSTGLGRGCGSQAKKAAINALGLDEKIREKILYSNARRLLKLKAG